MLQAGVCAHDPAWNGLEFSSNNRKLLSCDKMHYFWNLLQDAIYHEALGQMGSQDQLKCKTWLWTHLLALLVTQMEKPW